MCADGYTTDELPVSECPECGTPLDKDGEPTEGCNYSPVCEVCGGSPCDQSC